MVVCKFFLENRCTYGTSCKNEHIRPSYNEATLRKDIIEERPLWPLSVYAPGKHEPNLIVGTDRCPEEDRLDYYLSMRTLGNDTQYLPAFQQHNNQMETQITAIKANIPGAVKHYEKEKAATLGGAGSVIKPFAPFVGSQGGFGQSSPFTQSTSTTSASAFGQPSAFGTPTAPSSTTTATTASAFGQPSAFGTTSSSATPAFGQSSAFGSSVSAFGQPSSSSSVPSAFGSPSSAFGQSTHSNTTASAFGAPAFGNASNITTSGFGQTSNLAAASVFGKPSSLGAGSAFGQTSSLGGASAFGQTSSLGSGGSAFGQTSSLGSGGSAFGQTSSLGSGGSSFGQTSSLGSGGSAFGQTSSLGGAGSAFGQTASLGSGGSAFGQTPSLGGTSGFGKATSMPSAFGQSSFGQTSTPVVSANGFGQSASSLTSILPGSGDQSITSDSLTKKADADAPNSQRGTENNDINAFAAAVFEFQAIPESEPPMEVR